jgi:uncharacterized protein (TIGR03083 family)
VASTSGNVWPTIEAERKALAADLDGLDDAAWNTTSLCGNWTVRDVVAHLTAATRLSGPKFFGKLIGSGLKFERVQAKGIAGELGATPADTLAHFKAQVDSHGRPPGPIDTPLGEIIVHGEDIRRPLGLAHTYPTEALTRVAAFYAKSNLIIHGKSRVSGLTLRATDTDWSNGSGPLVTGPMLDLVMATAGRRVAYDKLSGDGVETLRARS